MPLLLRPLLLQVVHGVDPIYVGLVSLVISGGWTLGTFAVSGWSGRKEIIALWSGPLDYAGGSRDHCGNRATPDMLAVLTVAAFFMGFGVGIHNVHLLARTMASANKGRGTDYRLGHAVDPLAGDGLWRGNGRVTHQLRRARDRDQA